jgi:cob(I)alamin adenosyltransferase
MAVEETFDQPKIAINRVYTKRGDGGETSLVGGQRVPKDSARIEAYGTVDELNAATGIARLTAEEQARTRPQFAELARILSRVQHELFNLGSILATLPEDVHPKQPRITPAEIARLEAEMDRMNSVLPGLRSFVLPGGSRLEAELHACRTVCRRAERVAVALARQEAIDAQIVPYLNRLGDAFFVWSRWANHAAGAAEVLWDPNQPSADHD